MGNSTFDVRYVKLHFTLTLTEDAVLPRYKASALRGGIGEMLLRANCIRARKCEECDFKAECIVQRIMYPHMDIQPDYMSGGESIGFVTECEDYREEYFVGDEIKFNLLLFGKTIVYFSQVLNALYSLGMAGLGKNLARFTVTSITNTYGKNILQGDNIIMDDYRVCTLGDYIGYRKRQADSFNDKPEIRFKSPLTLKYKGAPLNDFNIEAIYEAACRRIYSLACLEGIETDIRHRNREKMPEITREEHRQVSVRRYSNHQEAAMLLKGIDGIITLSDIPEWMTDVLLVGELVHIGKNTSFGFGRYRIG